MEAYEHLRPQMNDDRRRRFGESGRMLALLCECAEADCHRTVLLSTAEYDTARPGPILHPDHHAGADASAGAA